MHELTILRELYRQLEKVARRYNARRVIRFRLQIGELANVVPSLLEEAFEYLKGAEPLLKDAVMEYEIVPLTLLCMDCGYMGEWRDRAVRCPDCGSLSVKVIDGEEMYLRDVELDIPDDD